MSPTSLASSTTFRLLALVVVAGLMLSSGLAVTASASPTVRPNDPNARTPGAGDDPDALELLAQAATAEQRVAYAGTQFVSVWTKSGSSSELVDLTNLPNHGRVVRVHGENTGPDTARFVVGEEADGDRLDVLAHSYAVVLAGTGQSAGRAATIIEARDGRGAVAARFWVDDATGLLLRRELYTADGSLERASAYVDLRIDPDVFVSHLPPMLEQSAGEVVEPAAYGGLDAAGWTCCAPDLAGTLRLDTVRRAAGGKALHLAYSDGLTTASVFEQRGQLDPSALEGFSERGTGDDRRYVRYGLSSYAVWSSGQTVYTAVSDTPRGLDALVAAFPHEGAASDPATGNGLGQRLDRGLTRMVSWLNPFD